MTSNKQINKQMNIIQIYQIPFLIKNFVLHIRHDPSLLILYKNSMLLHPWWYSDSKDGIGVPRKKLICKRNNLNFIPNMISPNKLPKVKG